MKRGRPPRGPKLVENLGGDVEAKRRLEVVLETLSGDRSVEDACAELGITETHFHRIRHRALAGALSALEPGTPGRPRTVPDEAAERIAELEDELADTKIDLRAAQIREEIAVLMPHLLQPKRPSKRPRKKKRRRK